MFSTLHKCPKFEIYVLSFKVCSNQLRRQLRCQVRKETRGFRSEFEPFPRNGMSHRMAVFISNAALVGPNFTEHPLFWIGQYLVFIP